MANMPVQEPWKEIEAIVDRGDAQRLSNYLDTLSPWEIARAVSRLDDENQAGLLTLLEPEDAADLIEELSDTQGADLIEDLPAHQAAAIVAEMDSDDRADVLGELDKGDAEAILDHMDPEEAADTRKLLTYDPNTAGGIMVTEFVTYPQHLRVVDVLNDLRQHAEQYSDYGVQYAYVVSERDVLIGVVRLRDLVLSPNEATLTSVMIANPLSVMVDAALDELEQFFDRYAFVGVPVIDADGRILGIVRRADFEAADAERSEKTFMRFSGIVAGDELRSMPALSRSVRRVSWLSLNMVLSVITATVIIAYQGTVQAVIVLAAFLPIICNTSGCSGIQSVAVSIRELALGITEPRDLLRVFRKEIGIGLVNGLILGGLLGSATFVWKGNLYLGIVVGGALTLNMLLAVTLGGVIPLVMRKIKIDPALASPVLTTFTDMCGFFLVLSFASAALSKLVV